MGHQVKTSTKQNSKGNFIEGEEEFVQSHGRDREGVTEVF